MLRLGIRWNDICSRKHIFKFMLLAIAILIIIQIVQLFVKIHYSAIPKYVYRLVVHDDTLDKVIEVNESFETDSTHKDYSWLQCKCKGNRSISLEKNFLESKSTCSKEATEIGLGQRVVSYSLYVSELEAVPYFLNGVVPNLKIIHQLYPGWLVRIYTNVPVNKYSCSLICNYENLFWCDITNIPELGDLSDVNGRMWRFLPMGDPTVEIFVSRDLDSLPTPRERSAVAEWERSNKTFHVMRDSQWHKTAILAGLWGARNSMLHPSVTKRLRTHFVEDGKSSQVKSWDQIILAKRIFYPFLADILAHDSYFCGKYKESITLPFPTKRNGEEFVGHNDLKEENVLFVGRLKMCPMECRPTYGKDWKYC